jgi:hypothetical protein
MYLFLLAVYYLDPSLVVARSADARSRSAPTVLRRPQAPISQAPVEALLAAPLPASCAQADREEEEHEPPEAHHRAAHQPCR